VQASSNSPLLRKFHLYGLCLTAAVLLVGLKGLDLGSLAAPLLLATGIASGFLGIAFYRESLFIRVNGYLFFLFLGIAFLVGESQPTQVVRLAACVCFLLLIKYCFPVEGFSRRFFQFFLGGYVFSTTAGLMVVVGLWEPSDRFLPVYQTFRFAGLYNATVLGIVSAVLAIWLLDELVYPKVVRAHWAVKSLLLAYSLFIMVLTLTRSAWIGFAAGGLAYLVVNVASGNLPWIVSRAVATVLIVLAILLGVLVRTGSYDLIKDRIVVDTLSRSSDAEVERAKFTFTRKALRLSQQNPLGLGLGAAGILGSEKEGLALGAHNTFAHVVTDLGWVTGVTFILWNLSVLARLWKGCRRNDVKYQVSFRMVFAGYVVLLFAGMFQDLILYMPMWIIPAVGNILVKRDVRKIYRVRWAAHELCDPGRRRGERSRCS